MGSRKREERRERAELARQHAERVKAQRKMRSRVLIVAGVIAVLAVVVMATRRGSGQRAFRFFAIIVPARNRSCTQAPGRDTFTWPSGADGA